MYAYIPDSTGVPPHTVQGEYWRVRDVNGDFSQASIGFKLKCESKCCFTIQVKKIIMLKKYQISFSQTALFSR